MQQGNPYGQPGGMMAPVVQQPGQVPQWPAPAQAASPAAPVVPAPPADPTLDALVLMSPDQQAAYGPVWGTWAPAQRAQVLAQLGIAVPPQGPPQGVPAPAPAGMVAPGSPYAAPPTY